MSGRIFVPISIFFCVLAAHGQEAPRQSPKMRQRVDRAGTILLTVKADTSWNIPVGDPPGSPVSYTVNRTVPFNNSKDKIDYSCTMTFKPWSNEIAIPGKPETYGKRRSLKTGRPAIKLTVDKDQVQNLERYGEVKFTIAGGDKTVTGYSCKVLNNSGNWLRPDVLEEMLYEIFDVSIMETDAAINIPPGQGPPPPASGSGALSAG